MLSSLLKARIAYNYEKILIWSDLHLDYKYSDRQIEYRSKNGLKWHNFQMPETREKDTLLLLGGDIVNGNHITLLEGFLTELCDKFGLVIMISGNHEYYFSNYQTVDTYLRGLRIEGFYYLQNEYLEIIHPYRESNNRLLIFGSTMWSDLSEHVDDQIIQESFAKDKRKMGEGMLSMEDYMRLHHQSFKALRRFVKKCDYDENTKVILLTHYALIPNFVPAKYKDYPNNCLFHSDIQEVLYYPIHLMICGHVHERADFHLKDVHCRSNPRGYPREETNFKYDDYLSI